MIKTSYMNNTSQDVRDFHTVIIEATKNNGVFADDYADIFQLIRTPEGSCAEWILEMAE